MTDRHGQPDLLTCMTKAPESGRIPPSARAEVTALLTRLMSEHIAAGAALPAEAADE